MSVLTREEINCLSARERLALIDALWNSVNDTEVPTPRAVIGTHPASDQF
jgi:hypothetical protein